MLYSYDFIGGENNSYAFVTKIGIAYEIKFKPSNYINLFNDNVSDFIFEFVIKVAINETGKNPPLDVVVSKTIEKYLSNFY